MPSTLIAQKRFNEMQLCMKLKGGSLGTRSIFWANLRGLHTTLARSSNVVSSKFVND